jgi:endo-1,4-beta-mannosidase
VSERFRLGVNYWPARTAMGWWADFDSSEVAEDFAQIAAAGFDSLRLFLTWEHFQPAVDRIDARMLERLVAVADLAAGSGLALVPTLFTGHMSGVNFIPPWVLGGSAANPRFRVVSGGRVVDSQPVNWYTDPAVARAQASLARAAAAVLAGHEALWAWDLGNESSNCAVPPSRAAARGWLERIASAIRASDPDALVTIGLHAEDLEEDRKLGPREAAEACDFLSMHGYPFYLRWAEGPTDTEVLPFLARVTRWLGRGREVLFSEFGLPTYRQGDPAGEEPRRRSACPLVEEQDTAAYTERALAGLREAGCIGAMLWCYADYRPELWQRPPFDAAIHERSFGLWRSAGSPKPAVEAVATFAGAARVDYAGHESWIDIETREFHADPAKQLPRLYRRYRGREPLAAP